MDNTEILNRFDVLYNNIMSNQAPGLDEYEKSVFWNKASIEVLKNHLNPKGNKYGEGFDYSAKRQIDFSSLIDTESIEFPLDLQQGNYSAEAIQLPLPEGKTTLYKNYLAIVNEMLDLLPDTEYKGVQIYITSFVTNMNMAETPHISCLTEFLDFTRKLPDDHPIKQKVDEFSKQITSILLIQDRVLRQTEWDNFKRQFGGIMSIQDVVRILNIEKYIIHKTVVPLNNVEYDTLMSRPYKRPPRSQVWRIQTNGSAEFTLPQIGINPIYYHIRYVAFPEEVDLSSDKNSSIPEILHDEILQRAVELAKNSWEGNLETTKAFGERSE